MKELIKEMYEPFKSRFEKAVSESTCQKRITVCVLRDAAWNILAIASNRCSPEGGACHRLGVVQGKENYDVHSHCNWTHAEINAIKAFKESNHTAMPYEAVLYGHTFYCKPCEDALKAIGVEKFTIIQPNP